MNFPQYLADLKILPVLTVEDEQTAVALCQALSRAGLRAVEITLRTAAALAALNAVKRALPDLQTAAGTVTRPAQMAQVKDTGADFAVSPGLTETLIAAANEAELPFLPGVATASEVIRGQELGITCFKLFPATAVGGLPLLQSLAAPLPTAHFCPTGGLNQTNFAGFLALPNVPCVGGSWMVGRTHLAAQDWSAIEATAAQAAQAAGLT